MKKKNLAFTLAEVLIVIGIIGVVAALTLPNLNHATGDKETVTRLMKIYATLNEANDRAVATYGPISTWKDDHWNERAGQFLKAKFLDVDHDYILYNRYCQSLMDSECTNIGELPDGSTFEVGDLCGGCYDCDPAGLNNTINDTCFLVAYVDIDGPKGKNFSGIDQFAFVISDSLGVIPKRDAENLESLVSRCMSDKQAEACTFWVIDYGNLDYLKTDESGKCNDSNIILDGTTNTSCH